MRVIAGRAKGRRLRAPPGRQTRPSGDRLKEGLFSSLGDKIAGRRVLDLYAGSGALGIEALSRGASSATFVEQDARAAQTIRQNLAATGLSAAGTVVQTAVETFLAGPAHRAYDIVLIDPPYELGLPSHVLQSLASGGLIDGDSTVLVEASVRLSLELPAGYVSEWERRYGDSILLRLRLGNGRT